MRSKENQTLNAALETISMTSEEGMTRYLPDGELSW